MAGWLRLYTDIKSDRKLRRLPPAQRWLWVVIMTIAKESPREGWLLLTEGVPVTVEDLTDDAAVSVDEVKSGLKAFIDQRMIEKIDGVYHLVNWNKRQFISDSSTERSRKHRQKIATLQERCNDVSATPPENREQRTDINNNDHDHDSLPAVNLVKSFEQEFGRPLSSMNVEQIRQWEKQYPPELTLEALRKAITMGKYNMQYIDSILLNWQKNNIRTLADVKAADKEFERRKQGGKSRGRDSPSAKQPEQRDYSNWTRPGES